MAKDAALERTDGTGKETTLGANWTILSADPITGELISPEERAYRAHIRDEAEQGMVGVDALYLAAHQTIHQPLLDEQGEVSGEGWVLERANNTTLRVAFSEKLDSETLEEVAVSIARAAIDDFAAEVMLHLFAIANDPPNWRRPELTIRLSELLDRLGFKRDSRGVHRSDARKKLSTTLLALYLTHVGVQRRARRRGERSVGFIAPLLSAVGYMTEEEVGHLSPLQVFQRGLPDTVSVTINALWYQGLRRPDGSAGRNYTLIPRPHPRAGGRARGGSRSPALGLLREYLLRYRRASNDAQLDITRTKLLEIAGITDRRVGQAGTTLGRALDGLIAERLLTAYAPRPLPLGPMDLISLTWDPHEGII
jgi:hypothetical protein